MTVCDICKQLYDGINDVCPDCKDEMMTLVECGDDDLRECANNCGEIVRLGGYCSTKCAIEAEEALMILYMLGMIACGVVLLCIFATNIVLLAGLVMK